MDKVEHKFSSKLAIDFGEYCSVNVQSGLTTCCLLAIRHLSSFQSISKLELMFGILPFKIDLHILTFEFEVVAHVENGRLAARSSKKSIRMRIV
jgi:hypothetical protein